jgi:hypothetical protein
MKENTNDKAKATSQEVKDRETTVEQRNDVKFEAEGACERIAGKDEKAACELKTGA